MGNPKSDTNDGKLFRYLLESPLININIGPTTFYNKIETAPDEILLSPSMANNLSIKNVEKSLSTDHGEIIIQFHTRFKKNLSTSNKTDWQDFRNRIDKELPIDTIEDIESVNNSII